MRFALLAVVATIQLQPTFAQVPQPGIYQVSKLVDYRPAWEFNYGVKTFLPAQHIPLVATYGTRYCLVAVDSTNGEYKVRLVFLPQPATAEGSVAFVGGLTAPQDTTASISYGSGENANYWADMGYVYFRGKAFLVHDNQLTHDSEAKNPSYIGKADDLARQLTVTPRNSLFGLAVARPYRTILPLETEKAFFYATPDTTSRQSDFVSKDQYVAILRQNGEWFEAETVSPAGTRRHGWLWQPELVKRVWIPQRRKTPLFRFQVAYADTAADANGQHTPPTDLRVISRKTGHVQQVVSFNIDEPGRGACNEALSVLDCNFDGFPDLMLLANSGGAGPNSTYSIYLFQPKIGRFVFDTALSELTQVDIDAKTRTISSAFRNGCCDHSREAYRFVNRRLTRTASHGEYCVSSDGYCTITEGRLVQGKWVEKHWRVKESERYPAEPPAKKHLHRATHTNRKG